MRSTVSFYYICKYIQGRIFLRNQMQNFRLNFFIFLITFKLLFILLLTLLTNRGLAQEANHDIEKYIVKQIYKYQGLDREQYHTEVDGEYWEVLPRLFTIKTKGEIGYAASPFLEMKNDGRVKDTDQIWGNCVIRITLLFIREVFLEAKWYYDSDGKLRPHRDTDFWRYEEITYEIPISDYRILYDDNDNSLVFTSKNDERIFKAKMTKWSNFEGGSVLEGIKSMSTSNNETSWVAPLPFTNKVRLPFELKGQLEPGESDKIIDYFVKLRSLCPTNEQEEVIEVINANMELIAGGNFLMGCNENDLGCSMDEKPAHNVTLKSFSMSKFEVTQRQYRIVTGNYADYRHKEYPCDECPVNKVSFEEALIFIKKLNEMSGKNYRLPTEAEWEFAARGGLFNKVHKYSGNSVLEKVAWFNTNSGGGVHHVGLRLPNEIGIYDMSGNVNEWCSDWYSDLWYDLSPEENPKGPDRGERRIIRGGSYLSNANDCRITKRYSASPYGYDDTGFRLAQDF